MSKIRQTIRTDAADSPIESKPTGDAKPYVIFTQLKDNGPHIYAGWLEATDDAMAIVLAKEHYGQDQECVNIWAIDRADLMSSDGLYGPPSLEGGGQGVGERPPGRGDRRSSDDSTHPPAPSPKGRGSWRVFTQKKAGDLFLEASEVEAASAVEAIEVARRAKPQAARAHCVWVAPAEKVVSTVQGEMIWRNTDQTYRLARGYTRDVKEKWQRFRQEEALKEYEKDDLQEAF